MGHCHPIPLSSMIQEMSRDATGTDSLEIPNIYKTKQKIYCLNFRQYPQKLNLCGQKYSNF